MPRPSRQLRRPNSSGWAPIPKSMASERIVTISARRGSSSNVRPIPESPQKAPARCPASLRNRFDRGILYRDAFSAGLYRRFQAENKALVRRYIEEVVNNANPVAVGEI